MELFADWAMCPNLSYLLHVYFEKIAVMSGVVRSTAAVAWLSLRRHGTSPKMRAPDFPKIRAWEGMSF